MGSSCIAHLQDTTSYQDPAKLPANKPLVDIFMLNQSYDSKSLRIEGSFIAEPARHIGELMVGSSRHGRRVAVEPLSGRLRRSPFRRKKVER